MNLSTHDWPRRIRAEYSMPAKEVIKLYARDKYSMWFTAGCLGISVNTLKAYCVREGIAFPNRMELREDCKSRPFGNCNNPLGRRAWASSHEKRAY
jgi:hypothetical protein